MLSSGNVKEERGNESVGWERIGLKEKAAHLGGLVLAGKCCKSQNTGSWLKDKVVGGEG